MANRYPLPPVSELEELFVYEPKTGVLLWKTKPDNPWWNQTFAGKPAGGLDSKGYVRIRTQGRIWSAHRVVWKLVHGVDPEYIDHINGVRSDNRLENLRSVTMEGNARNRCLHSKNTSGISGVYWVQRDKKWVAFIYDNGTKVPLGYYSDKKDAVTARRKAEASFGYHNNHGRRVGRA